MIRVKTTAEVYFSLLGTHSADLVLHSSFSDSGNATGYGCRMETFWALRGSDKPFLYAELTWDRSGEPGYEYLRENEKHSYALLFPEEGDF